MKKSSYWPIGIAGFFTLFVLLLIGFIIFSRTHKSNLVTQNYYEQEIKYQDQIDRAERTRALQNALVFHYDKTNKTVLLQFPAETSPDKISGKILFFRPSDAKQDRIIPIKPAGDNQQKIDVKNLSRGFWRVKIFWAAKGMEYYDEETLIVE